MKGRSITLPRPKRTTARVKLSVAMHPHQLAELEARAVTRGMSFTAYIAALFDSDADDVAGPGRRMFSLGELAAPERAS